MKPSVASVLVLVVAFAGCLSNVPGPTMATPAPPATSDAAVGADLLNMRQCERLTLFRPVPAGQSWAPKPLVVRPTDATGHFGRSDANLVQCADGDLNGTPRSLGFMMVGMPVLAVADLQAPNASSYYFLEFVALEDSELRDLFGRFGVYSEAAKVKVALSDLASLPKARGSASIEFAGDRVGVESTTGGTAVTAVARTIGLYTVDEKNATLHLHEMSVSAVQELVVGAGSMIMPPDVAARQTPELEPASAEHAWGYGATIRFGLRSMQV